MKRQFLSALVGACLFCFCLGQTHASTLYVGVTDQSFHGVATFTENLGLIQQIGLPVSDPITGLAGGVGGNFYASAGNMLYQFDAAGNVLGSINGSPTTMLPALSFVPDLQPTPVPEPTTIVLLITGFLLLYRIRRRTIGAVGTEA